jgi:hypothetical protein
MNSSNIPANNTGFLTDTDMSGGLGINLGGISSGVDTNTALRPVGTETGTTSNVKGVDNPLVQPDQNTSSDVKNAEKASGNNML